MGVISDGLQDEEEDKIIGLFRLSLGALMQPLRLYGQGHLVDGSIEQIISLSLQMHLKLQGLDEMPYIID